MKIVKVKAAGLRGRTPEGGWANEIRPEDCVHTLIAVYTDEGVTGWGSVFTNDALVQAALRVLEPLYLGENPLEPERVLACRASTVCNVSARRLHSCPGSRSAEHPRYTH